MQTPSLNILNLHYSLREVMQNFSRASSRSSTGDKSQDLSEMLGGQLIPKV